MIVKSNAKINVSLKIVGKREDDYHLLEMVNLPLELHDIIEIDTYPHLSDTYITCDDIGLSNVKINLCQRAVTALRDKFKFKENFVIRIHKEIPFAAGLGGGSSNAAAVMMAVDSMLRLKVSQPDLITIGAALGADVPFFLIDRPAKITGIGEIISPIKVAKSYECLIVKPATGLSTKSVFAVADNFPHAEIDTDGVIAALGTGDDKLLAASVGNDLFLPSISLLPEIGPLVSSLKADGFLIVSMSGSGSSVFALSDDAKKCKLMAKKYEKLGYVVCLTKTTC